MRGTQKIGLGLLLILIAWISAAQATDLVGNWTGSTRGYVGADGAYNLVENDSISFAIFEQNDRLFTGNVTYTRDGEKIIERPAVA